MKRLQDVGAVTLRIPEAANEEFANVPAPEAPGRAPSAGWDPYEVWRTRVKDETLPERGSRTA
jgi:hypothetical protein